MQIGIIGSGNIGETVARHAVAHGHEVAIANSRGPDSLVDLVADLGPNARAATVTEAARFGEVVVEAIPFGAYDSLPADALADKTVVSAANYYPDRDGAIEFGERTQTELVADHLADATVVKAFNTMHYETLREAARPDAAPADRLVLFLAGDDPRAKSTVAGLIETFGFAPVDVGRLADAWVIEPGSPLYNEPMTVAEATETLAELRATE
jgi:hypothetical protein